MESKVHEATNNEPWGASSTLLQEIAQGTYNYQYFNEIMPTIYRRFTEKESRQWRQIYKALVLLEYLIKNGSERVIDDARAHVSMVKVMRNFFYIDDKGKDEGINVRNRAKEIVELLGDTEKIRSERKLAKKNRTKYIGVGSDSLGGRESMRGGMGVSGISKYVGFGNDTFGSGGNRGISFNGDALTFEGEVNPYPRQTSVGKYDIDDDEEDDDDFGPEVSPSQTKSNHADNNKSNDDDWGDFEFGGVAQSSTTSSNQQQNVLDDDFSDFQVASTSQTTTSQSSKQPDLFDLLNDDDRGTTHTATPGTTHSLAAFETKQPMTPRTSTATVSPPAPPQAPSNPEPVPATTGIWAQASGFVALDSLGKKTNLNTPTKGPSMNTLKNTNIQADWNNWATNNPQQPQTPKKSTAFDDLLSL
ncbi:hypothetical protein EDC96DRAFT_519237 [Choanephora cucurbitarum]|nr:hypothetical protein EDC96DRAFT_519237 [Choanephora cucurbitarum]